MGDGSAGFFFERGEVLDGIVGNLESTAENVTRESLFLKLIDVFHGIVRWRMDLTLGVGF